MATIPSDARESGQLAMHLASQAGRSFRLDLGRRGDFASILRTMNSWANGMSWGVLDLGGNQESPDHPIASNTCGKEDSTATAISSSVSTP